MKLFILLAFAFLSAVLCQDLSTDRILELYDVASSADFGKWSASSNRIQLICDEVKGDLEQRMGVTFEKYEAQLYHNITVEDGIIYRVWMDIGEDSYLEVTLLQQFKVVPIVGVSGQVQYEVQNEVLLIMAEWVVEEFTSWQDANDEIQKIVEDRRNDLSSSDHLFVGVGPTTNLTALRYQTYRFRGGIFYRVEVDYDNRVTNEILIELHLPDPLESMRPVLVPWPHLLDFKLPLCQLQQLTFDHFVSQNPGASGILYPSCNEDWFFNPKQCYGSTGDCWCVNPVNGTVIDGTFAWEVDHYRPPAECGEVPENTTLVLYKNGFSESMDADDEIQKISDRYKRDVFAALNITTLNKYEAVAYQVQYIGGTHYKIELDIGEETFVEMRVFESLPVQYSSILSLLSVERIDSTKESPLCEIQNTQLDEMMDHWIYEPQHRHQQCLKDGRFNSTQCSTDSSACWCVNENTGKVISGSIRPDYMNINCDEIQENTSDGPTVTDDEEYCFWKVFKESLLRQMQDYKRI